MIVYQGGIQIEPKPMTLSPEFIGSWVCTIVLFNLYAIVIFVANLNLLDKNIKNGYNHYHYLSRDSEMFLLIIQDHCPLAPTIASFIDTSWFLFVGYQKYNIWLRYLLKKQKKQLSYFTNMFGSYMVFLITVLPIKNLNSYPNLRNLYARDYVSMLDCLHLTIPIRIIRLNRSMWLWSIFELMYIIFKIIGLSDYLVPSLLVTMLALQLFWPPFFLQTMVNIRRQDLSPCNLFHPIIPSKLGQS